MYQIRISNTFKKDTKKLKNDPKAQSKLRAAINTLAAWDVLDPSYRDHALQWDFVDHRECHIGPDTLLIYKIDHWELILVLVRYGSHSKLFG